MFNNLKYIIFFLCIILCGCKSKKPVTEDEVPLCGPTFCEDSAYVFCAEQCQFGPRTMNSEAHEQCAEWIINKFKGYGCTVVTQKANLQGWDGTMLASTNIIASINPNIKERYLLCAHWDSRPWADNDIDEKNHHTPVMAANDGASGVAVMLEIARIIGDSIGIDFVCFDAEDYGSPQWSDNHDENSWALGSQYFAQQYDNGTSAIKGPWQGAILLDMVGGQGAHFYQEGL
ncbi:MAG: M28 family peptidase, partial [Prevotella sp.]|nr:M28 family peptidase [Prevotella sp.]